MGHGASVVGGTSSAADPDVRLGGWFWGRVDRLSTSNVLSASRRSPAAMLENAILGTAKGTGGPTPLRRQLSISQSNCRSSEHKDHQLKESKGILRSLVTGSRDVISEIVNSMSLSRSTRRHRPEVEQLLPAYYTNYNSNIKQKDVIAAKVAWELIINDMSPEYIRRKSMPNFSHPNATCLSWFFDTFYDKFYSIDSSIKALYKDNMKVQARALMGMINTIINAFKLPENKGRALFAIAEKNAAMKVLTSKREAALKSIAKGHTKMGIKAYQYPIMGEALLSSLEKCLGDKIWTREVRLTWSKMFSAVLDVILPAACREERLEMKRRAKEDANSIRRANTAMVAIESSITRSLAPSASVMTLVRGGLTRITSSAILPTVGGHLGGSSAYPHAGFGKHSIVIDDKEATAGVGTMAIGMSANGGVITAHRHRNRRPIPGSTVGGVGGGGVQQQLHNMDVLAEDEGSLLSSSQAQEPQQPHIGGGAGDDEVSAPQYQQQHHRQHQQHRSASSSPSISFSNPNNNNNAPAHYDNQHDVNSGWSSYSGEDSKQNNAAADLDFSYANFLICNAILGASSSSLGTGTGSSPLIPSVLRKHHDNHDQSARGATAALRSGRGAGVSPVLPQIVEITSSPEAMSPQPVQLGGSSSNLVELTSGRSSRVASPRITTGGRALSAGVLLPRRQSSSSSRKDLLAKSRMSSLGNIQPHHAVAGTTTTADADTATAAAAGGGGGVAYTTSLTPHRLIPTSPTLQKPSPPLMSRRPRHFVEQQQEKKDYQQNNEDKEDREEGHEDSPLQSVRTDTMVTNINDTTTTITDLKDGGGVQPGAAATLASDSASASLLTWNSPIPGGAAVATAEVISTEDLVKSLEEACNRYTEPLGGVLDLAVKSLSRNGSFVSARKMSTSGKNNNRSRKNSESRVSRSGSVLGAVMMVVAAQKTPSFLSNVSKGKRFIGDSSDDDDDEEDEQKDGENKMVSEPDFLKNKMVSEPDFLTNKMVSEPDSIKPRSLFDQPKTSNRNIALISSENLLRGTTNSGGGGAEGGGGERGGERGGGSSKHILSYSRDVSQSSMLV